MSLMFCFSSGSPFRQAPESYREVAAASTDAAGGPWDRGPWDVLQRTCDFVSVCLMFFCGAENLVEFQGYIELKYCYCFLSLLLPFRCCMWLSLLLLLLLCRLSMNSSSVFAAVPSFPVHHRHALNTSFDSWSITGSQHVTTVFHPLPPVTSFLETRRDACSKLVTHLRSLFGGQPLPPKKGRWFPFPWATPLVDTGHSC